MNFLSMYSMQRGDRILHTFVKDLSPMLTYYYFSFTISIMKDRYILRVNLTYQTNVFQGTMVGTKENDLVVDTVYLVVQLSAMRQIKCTKL